MQEEITKNNFLPDFCSVRMVFAVVVTAQLLAMLLALASWGAATDFWNLLSVRSLYVQWIALTSTALLCLFKQPLTRLGHVPAGLVAWVLILIVALIVSELAYRLPEPLTTSDLSHLAFVGQSLGISAIVAAIVLRYLFEQYQQRERELAETRARYQALQARIRPHFLFNSMNTIANLTRSDPEMAEEVVQDLADLFRVSLAEAGRLSTLEKEQQIAQGYLRIERQRLGERLHVEWDMADDLPMDASLPMLILQPLLENAVYHGIEPAPAGGEVLITGSYRHGMINLSIRNSLPPAGETSSRKGNHIALANVKERLATAFDDAASLTLGQVDGYFQVLIAFPYLNKGSGKV